MNNSSQEAFLGKDRWQVSLMIEGGTPMMARWSLVVALVALLGPAWQSQARAGDAQSVVQDYLDNLGARGYTITPITNNYVLDTFPNIAFFQVMFRQYPVAVLPPKGLSSSNLFAVAANGDLEVLTSFNDFPGFFLDNAAPVEDQEEADDTGAAFVRLAEAFFQDGYYVFRKPNVKVKPAGDGVGLVVKAHVNVKSGGTGRITVLIDIDGNGAVDDASATGAVRPGVRPICQATKLLDPDPIVRKMAEQAILVMGRTAKPYLDEQRAKARPELKKAIDRIWKRIVDEGR
jgi:hypothetical protein